MNNNPKLGISFLKTNAQIREFKKLSFQPGTETINISNNLLFDFEGFAPPESLKVLIMDSNPILTFNSFPVDETPNLEEISLINSPISRIKNFRSLCLIVFGLKLTRINGLKVTREDRNIALKYGDSEKIRPLLLSGWIAQRPITIDEKSMNSIQETIKSNENDPFSLKSVSILRMIGYSRSEIKEFLRLYFSPAKKTNKIKSKNKIPSSIEEQVQKQQEIINILSTQLQELRNENQNYNRYTDMIETIGAPLIENKKIVAEFTSKNKSNESNPSELKSSKDDDYLELRKAALELLEENDSIDDNELIQKLSELIPNEEEDN